MKTYLAGPMTGIENWNHPAFYAKAAELRSKGIDVINPAEFDEEVGLDQPWSAYLRRDLVLLAEECDSMVLLPGWEYSKGARLEHHVGTELGFIIEYPDGSISRSPTSSVSVIA